MQEEPDRGARRRAGRAARRRSASSRAQPFAPDDRHARRSSSGRHDRRRHGPSVAYAPRDPDAVLYGSWKNAFVGGSHEFLRDGARLLDARTQFHYLATVITPAMAHAQVGAGSAYAYTVHDANGDLLDGARTYRLHVDAEPAGQELLGRRRLRHPDPLAAPGPIDALPRAGQQLRHPPGQRRRLLRPLLRARRRPRARRRTGSRPSPASPGSSSSGSTARSSPGSTRPGGSTSSSPCKPAAAVPAHRAGSACRKPAAAQPRDGTSTGICRDDSAETPRRT